MSRVATHKVFVSFYHEDEKYKDLFAKLMDGHIVDKLVEDGDIDPQNSTEYTRQVIRDEFIADATVTVVLIGRCTWQRKHVDWEIGSSLRATKKNPRCGLLGIILPSHSDYKMRGYYPHLIPPRLADNSGSAKDYARIHDWIANADSVNAWIDIAYKRRDYQPDPDNSREQFKNNRAGTCSAGWQD